MNKSESKYFNTARLMDEAILLLLENKDLEFITVKEICKKAGVNRSTFYLHYENIDELLAEAIEMLNERFEDAFKNVKFKELNSCSKEEVVFIKEKYIKPYLSFVKENKRAYKTIYNKPQLFDVGGTFKRMYLKTFAPILKKFNVPKNEEPFRFEFYTRGVSAIVSKWLELNCEESIENITKIIIDCVNIDQTKLK